jgi:hypothetical protein
VVVSPSAKIQRLNVALKTWACGDHGAIHDHRSNINKVI